jgi:hypothetical protein
VADDHTVLPTPADVTPAVAAAACGVDPLLFGGVGTRRMTNTLMNAHVQQIARVKQGLLQRTAVVPKRVYLQRLQAKVQLQVERDMQLPQEHMKLVRDLAYEETQQKNALIPSTLLLESKSNQRNAATKVKVGRKTNGKADEKNLKEKPAVVVADVTPVTTILLTYLDYPEAPPKSKKRAPKKILFAMVLWADGPSTCPVSQLNPKSYLVQEYNMAAMRGAMEAGCRYCQNAGTLTLTAHSVHLDWHDKFRRYCVLREQVLPWLKDADPRKDWKQPEVQQVLETLMHLWSQVDGGAPWFATKQFLVEKTKAATKALNA